MPQTNGTRGFVFCISLLQTRQDDICWCLYYCTHHLSLLGNIMGFDPRLHLYLQSLRGSAICILLSYPPMMRDVYGQSSSVLSELVFHTNIIKLIWSLIVIDPGESFEMHIGCWEKKIFFLGRLHGYLIVKRNVQ